MKNLALLFTLILVGCSSPDPTMEEIAKSNIEQHLNKVLHDPSSYEFVEMSPFDSITNLDKMELDIEFNMGLIPIHQRGLTAAEGLLESQKEGLRLGRPIKDKVNETQAKVDEKRKNLQALVDNTQKMMDAKKTASIDTVYNYTTQFSYRAKNKMGALVLLTKEVKLEKDMTFVKMSE